MNERTVRVVNTVILEQSCSKCWEMVDNSVRSSGVEDAPWNYFCGKHRKHFSLIDSCPGSYQRIERGEFITIPSKLAESLVQKGQAVYPSHAPEVDEGIQATLDRTNSLMDEIGLPHLDAESVKTWSIKGKKGSSHYSRPKDNRLASDLGINPSDIADIRRLSRGG